MQMETFEEPDQVERPPEMRAVRRVGSSSSVVVGFDVGGDGHP